MPRRGAALLALAAIVMGGCGSGGENPVKAPSHPPAGRKPVIFEPGPLELTGDARDQTLDEIAAMGVDRIRMVVFWSRVLPVGRPASFDGSNPGDPAYDFSPYDSFMRAAAERGFKVLVTISGLGPAWTNEGGAAEAPPDVSAFGDFARAVATRYSGHYSPASGGGELPAATMWSVWNEPNLSLFLKPQYVDGRPYSPILYRHLFIAAQDAIRAADPSVPILIGDTAPTGSTDSVDPVPFARGVLCLDPATDQDPSCSERIDPAGWATHPYQGTGQAPFEPPAKGSFVTLSAIGSLTHVLHEAAVAGTVGTELPIYITEYGIQSRPDPLGVPLQTQADWLSISEQLAYAYPRVRTYAQYLMRDDPPDHIPGVAYGGFESGLRFYDGPKKPSFDSFRLPLAVRREGDKVSIWGLVRPATGVTTAEVRVADGGIQKTLKRVRTDPAGIISFDSSYLQGRLWQLRWRSPGGETFEGPWTRSYEYSVPGG